MDKPLVSIKNYAWRNGSRTGKFSPVVFGTRIDWLQERLGHAPKSSEVLEDARDPKSPIHEMFNWDDEEAAEKFRVLQASVLLSSLVVKVEVVRDGKTENIDMPVRVVLNRKNRHNDGGGHEHIRDIMNNDSMRARMLTLAADELTSIQRRYSYIRELGRVFQEVDVVVKKKLPLIQKKLERK